MIKKLFRILPHYLIWVNFSLFAVFGTLMTSLGVLGDKAWMIIVGFVLVFFAVLSFFITKPYANEMGQPYFACDDDLSMVCIYSCIPKEELGIVRVREPHPCYMTGCHVPAYMMILNNEYQD